MKLSYAQRLEDYHLELVFADVADGFYVDVGGGHPVADNVSFWFYLKGWRGLVVEPQRQLAELYAHVRPRDVVFRGLVGDREGEVDFHIVDRLHGFSTTVESNARSAADLGAGYATQRMPMRRLADLTAEHGIKRIDFLKIDVEGAEPEVLRGADWRACRPRIVVVEAVAPGSMAETWQEWEPFVLSQGYAFAFFDGLNRFYVANEESGLADRFPSEPAPWDRVQHLWDFGRAPDKPEHPDHVLAAELVRGFLAALPSLDHKTLAGILQSRRSDVPPAQDDIRRLLFGTGEFPGAPVTTDGAADVADLYAKLMDSDRFRAALGRIASAYDGGHLMD